MGSDDDWRRWGDTNPYFGVVSHDEFRGTSLDPETLERFLASGRRHVDRMFAVLERHFDVEGSLGRVADFGCGTGRLTIPLARRAEHAVGVDVSEGALREARRNAEAEGVANTSFVLSPTNDDLRQVITEPVDLVHSTIVFQHIPKRRGEQLFASLVSCLAPGGFGVIQMTFGDERAPARRLQSWVQFHVPGAKQAANLARRRPLSEPVNRMENYSVMRITRLLRDAGIGEFFAERTDHGGHVGLALYFRKPLPLT